MARPMKLFPKGKINPLIDLVGVSAVPMAARVSQVEGRKAGPANVRLMHARGPNVPASLARRFVAGYVMAVPAEWKSGENASARLLESGVVGDQPHQKSYPPRPVLLATDGQGKR